MPNTAGANPAEESALVDAVNRFSFALRPHVDRDPAANAIFSPLSAFACIALCIGLFRGATRQEIVCALQISGDGAPGGDAPVEPFFAALLALLRGEAGEEVASASRVWLAEGLELDEATLRPFAETLKLPVLRTRFPEPGREEINADVLAATRGMIRDCVARLPGDTLLVLVNAMYFKGVWAAPFTPCRADAPDATFLCADGVRRAAPMMSVGKARVGHAAGGGVELVAVPYRGGTYAFLMYVGAARTPEGYQALQRVDYAAMRELRRQLKWGEYCLTMPKFTVEAGTTLEEAMCRLGMTRVFTPAAEGVDGRVPLQVSSIIHKAKIVVDEEGTEAAAATVVMMRRSLPMPVPKICVDAPFLYQVVNLKTGVVVFEGMCRSP